MNYWLLGYSLDFLYHNSFNFYTQRSSAQTFQNNTLTFLTVITDMKSKYFFIFNFFILTYLQEYSFGHKDKEKYIFV